MNIDNNIELLNIIININNNINLEYIIIKNEYL